MEPSEEQAAELEALEAIFQGDYRLIESATSERGARFDIQIAPDSPSDLRLRVAFEHTIDYPTTCILVTIHALSGLSAIKRKALQGVVENLASENIGIPSAFTICEGLNEWLYENMDDVNDISAEQEEESFETRDTSAVAKVEVVASKAIGTPVTVETFAAWREKFLEELEGKKTEEQRAMEMNTKLTGRQLFEQSKDIVSGESESLWEMEAELYTEENEDQS